MKRRTLLQIWPLFAILLSNFVAQIVYFRHLYYSPEHPLPALRSILMLGTVFALFIIGYSLFISGKRTGFYLLAFYLALEFLFYLWNIVSQVVHGYGLFFHLSEPDPILWAVFAVGYLSFFASGYFLFILISERAEFAHGL